MVSLGQNFFWISSTGNDRAFALDQHDQEAKRLIWEHDSTFAFRLCRKSQFSSLQVKFKCPEANANWQRFLHGIAGGNSGKPPWVCVKVYYPPAAVPSDFGRSLIKFLPQSGSNPQANSN